MPSGAKRDLKEKTPNDFFSTENPKSYPNLTIYIDYKLPHKFVTIVSVAV